MRLGAASPLLLLLTPLLVRADSLPSEQLNHLRRREDAASSSSPHDKAVSASATATTTRSSPPTSRPYRGTEDAPVDGLDGKPHAGPFVDSARDDDGDDGDDDDDDDERWRLDEIPARNDGVMNDEHTAPNKGTTGTEGGISEKERLKKEAGDSAGNTPQEPKSRPEPLEEEVERTSQRIAASSGKDYPGSLGRPNDLPARPHDIPHPRASRTGDNPPAETSDWLHPTLPYTEGPEQYASRDYPSPKLTSAGGDDESWHEWFHSFVLSLTMILFSEIGDKTFLVAALMAMRHNQILVFTAALSALILMTGLSAILGHAVPTLLPKRLTTLAAALLFLVFGARMLREGLAMPRDSGVGEEMKEVEAELEEKEHSMAIDRSRRRSSASVSSHTLESGRGRQLSQKPGQLSPAVSRSPSPAAAKDRLAGLMNLLSLVLSPAWVQTFVMTFLGEWGDRSQIATIAMAAGQDYWWVTLGAITGHACCTGLAVIGGRALAGKVSMRVVTIGGAAAFLVFGVIYVFECMFE